MIGVEKTQPVKKQQATGNKTESHLDFLFVELLNCLEERHAEVGYKIYRNNLRGIFVTITRNGLFGITVNIITVNMFFFINKQKGKKGIQVLHW